MCSLPIVLVNRWERVYGLANIWAETACNLLVLIVASIEAQR